MSIERFIIEVEINIDDKDVFMVWRFSLSVHPELRGQELSRGLVQAVEKSVPKHEV